MPKLLLKYKKNLGVSTVIYGNLPMVKLSITNLKSSQKPSTSTQSDKMSKELKAKGFKFVGSTICYSFMQASGMVNDHTLDCFRYQEIQKISFN